MRRSLAALLALACTLSGAVALSPGASAAVADPAAAPATGGYVPLASPVRTANLVTVGARATASVRVAGGTTGVPQVGAVAAAQVSALNPSSTGALTVYRKGATRPAAATVQFNAHTRGSALALVPAISTSGGLASVYNSSSGAVQIVVDVVGYYLRTGTSVAAKAYTPVSPARIIDTTLSANRSVSPVLGGHGNLPAKGIGAVAVNFAEFDAHHAGGLLAGAYSESGVPQQVLNWPGDGRRVGGFAILPTDTDGQVTLANLSAGSVRITVGVVGWYAKGAPSVGGMIDTPPTALLAKAQYSAGQSRTVAVAGKAGVPLHGVSAVALSLLAGSTRSTGSILTSRGGGASSAVGVQYSTGVRGTNTVLVPVADDGTIQLRNNGTGDVNVSANVVGWVLSGDLDVPSVTTSRYLDDLRTDDDTGNESTMADHGASDAADDPSLVLLDVGAQSYRKPDLSTAHPGVALALTSPTQRLTYPQLVSAVQSYVNALAAALPTSHDVTVAVGTNNSGNFTDNSDPDNPVYPAATRGTDWAEQVVEQIVPPTGFTIVGANDIENGNPDIDGFDPNAPRAIAWESAYLDAHPANADGSPDLIFNGAANGCPSVFGSGTGSTQCADTWTLDQFVKLTHRGNRIGVLPQIYYPYMAIQWANIDRVSGHVLDFVGSLAQPTAVGSLPAVQSWAALHNALSTGRATLQLPAAIDLEPSSSAGKKLEGLRAVA